VTRFRHFSRAGIQSICVFCLLVVATTIGGTANSVQPEPAATPQILAKDREKLKELRSTVMQNPKGALQKSRQLREQLEQRPETDARQITIAETLRMDGDANIRLGNADAAEALLNKAEARIAGIRGTLKVSADIKISQGSLLTTRGDPAGALEQFHSAYDIYRRLGDRRGQSVALQNIAALYTEANDNEKAERYYEQAGSIYDSDVLLSTYLHNNRANVLLQLERYSDAETQYLSALKGARTLKSQSLIASIYDNLARTGLESGNLAKASAYLNRAFAVAPTVSDPMLATRARLLLSQGRKQQAKQVIGRIFGNRPPGEVDSYYEQFVAYQVYAAVGDDTDALRHLQIAKRLNDEATQVASSTNAALAAARFDFQNQELRIAKLKAEELRRNVAFERSTARFQRTLFASIGGATLVLIIVLSFSLVTIGRSRNRNREAKLELADTNAALEKALAAKTEFLATTSHEIRTPLNGILGMTQVMLADRHLPGELRDRVGVIHGAGITMRALVDDILDVAKMETGKLTIEHRPMDLHAALREVAAVWHDQARSRGLAFALDIGDTPRWIMGDSGRLRQILFNLLANAIKFTEQGRVALAAQAIGIGGFDYLRITVTDTGIGIPADKCEDIFESFKQVDGGTTRKFGGTGLGLSICRNLATALGGTIGVESEEGAGSRFIVTLPLVLAEAPDVTDTGEADCGTLLILERNPIARGMLRKLLEGHGMHLRFAGSAGEMLAQIAARPPAQVLLDAGSLADDEGQLFETIEEISHAAHRIGVSITLLWKVPNASARARMMEAGIDDIIDKPIAGPALVRRLFGESDEQPEIQPLVSRAT